MLPFNLVILGPQGSGKGTQADRLKTKFQMPLLVAGDLIREKVKDSDSLAQKIAQIINDGHLIPHEIVKNLFDYRLKEIDSAQTVLFDAWPRCMDQVDDFEDLISKREAKDFKILVTEISEAESVKRLSVRRVCQKCLTNFMPPQSLSKICPKCRGKLQQREDDYPEAIKTRLQVYQNETKPVVDYYQKQNKVVRVNGEQSIENVSNEIIKKLQEVF